MPMMRLLTVLFVCVFLAPCLRASAQEANQEQNSPRELAQQSEALKTKIEAATSLNEEAKQPLLDVVKVVEANLAEIEALRQRQAEDLAVAKTAKEVAENAERELAKLAETKPKIVDKSQPLSSMELAAAAEKQALEKVRADLDAIEKKIVRRDEVRQKLRTTLESIDDLLSETTEALRSLPADNGSLESEAERLKQRVKLRLIEVEKESANAKILRLDAEDAVNLRRNQRDLLKVQFERSQSRVANLEKILAEQRQEQAREVVEAAAEKQKGMAKKYPLLAASYEINTVIAQRRQEIEGEFEKFSARAAKLAEKYSDLKELKKDTIDRVDAIGLSGSVGAMLRKRRADLALELTTRLQDDEVKEELDKIQFERFDKKGQRDELDFDVIVEEIETLLDGEGGTAALAKLRKLRPLAEQDLKATEGDAGAAGNPANSSANRATAGESKLNSDDIAKLKSPIEELIVSRKQKLENAADGLDRLFKKLLEIQLKETQLSKLVTEFREYINERILWIRSNDVLFSKLQIDDSDMDVVDPVRWSNAGGKIWDTIARRPLAYSISSLIIVLLILLKPRMRKEIDRLGQVAVKGTCETFWPTLHALGLSLLIAITIPLIPLIVGLGIMWSRPTDNSLFDAIGSGLLAMAWFAMPMEILRRFCRPKGLANLHFDWPDAAVDRLKTNLDWMILPSALIVFTHVTLLNLAAAHEVDLIERILFVGGMGVFAYFLYRTFNTQTGIFAAYLKNNENSWANQLSLVWFGFILLIPVTLAILAIWGYYYTAINLASCTFATFVFALVVETLRAMMRRLIMLSRRRVHIQAARRKREVQIKAQQEAIKAKEEAEKALAAAKVDSEIDASSLPAPATAPIPSVESLIDLRPADDIDDNALRATKLVSLSMIVVWAIGLWLIWADVLPALKKLDEVTVWSNEVVQMADSPSETPKADTPMPNAMSASSTGASDSTATTVSGKRVSFRDLLKFIVISLLTLVGARNLPAALEMLFLDHLPVDRSFRYATKALTSYAIVMLGMVLAFNALSISWNNVQWLATALTFGLAFGLQEIFANFVAGIILMFERPIRIGDWITVDEFTGVVTKIRTRATTIVNWDRKEYVIPNKDFITGRLINWTLSDAINRIVINVGVAYGSDVVKAKKILLEVCSQHPKTVADPPTSVAFNEFGASALNLVARTFISDVESRVPVTDDLHTQINQAFNEAGIEISFPQQDLHIRSFDPDVAKILSAQTKV